MEEGRKRVLGIIAGILVARHLKTTEDLFDTRDSPRTRSMVASAVQWAERIMKKIDNVTACQSSQTPGNPFPWDNRTSLFVSARHYWHCSASCPRIERRIEVKNAKHSGVAMLLIWLTIH